jgi:hypothetical protein
LRQIKAEEKYKFPVYKLEAKQSLRKSFIQKVDKMQITMKNSTKWLLSLCLTRFSMSHVAHYGTAPAPGHISLTGKTLRSNYFSSIGVQHDFHCAK